MFCGSQSSLEPRCHQACFIALGHSPQMLLMQRLGISYIDQIVCQGKGQPLPPPSLFFRICAPCNANFIEVGRLMLDVTHCGALQVQPDLHQGSTTLCPPCAPDCTAVNLRLCSTEYETSLHCRSRTCPRQLPCQLTMTEPLGLIVSQEALEP